MRLFRPAAPGKLRAERVTVERRLSRRGLLAAACACCVAATTGADAQTAAQTPAQPAAPQFATRKLSDNAYLFRYAGHQSLFVVTPAGVIVTDPIASNRPQAADAYLAEIRKITQAPIKYVVYSHHHFDHIAGGKVFKDQGARFIAHANAKEHLAVLKNPQVIMPDQGVGNRHDITLGGVKLELHYVGRNHSDSSLVMRLPKEKMIFAVDFLPIESVMFRNMPDSFLPDWFASIDKVLAMEWDSLIPGHPNAGGRLGTKDDVRNLKAYMTDLRDAVQAAAKEGRCYDRAMAEIKLVKYEKWGGYAQYMPGNVERFCAFYNGI